MEVVKNNIYCIKCKTRTETISSEIKEVLVGKDKLRMRFREVGLCKICEKGKSRFTTNPKVISEEQEIETFPIKKKKQKKVKTIIEEPEIIE